MSIGLISLLTELRGNVPSSVVLEREVVELESELGRPLPQALRALWSIFGAGRLGGARISSPKEISCGLSLSDRCLDEGLLPVGLGPDGEPWMVRLGGDEIDPGLFLAVDFPSLVRAELGPLTAAVEACALDALCTARPELAERLETLDPDRRFRSPLAWVLAAADRTPRS